MARWNEQDQRIEMWLRSLESRTVRVDDLDLEVEFAAGEEMLTEISTKFSPESLNEELNECGFVVESTWTSPDDAFLLSLSRPSS